MAAPCAARERLSHRPCELLAGCIRQSQALNGERATKLLSYDLPMDPTVLVAAIGFFATILVAALGASAQRTLARDSLIYQSRLGAYSQCLAALFEFERATFNRVKMRLDGVADREAARSDAWQSNALARTAIANLALYSSPTMSDRLEAARFLISSMTKTTELGELQSLHGAVNEIADLAKAAQKELRKSLA